jgi:hypothetical protein
MGTRATFVRRTVAALGLAATVLGMMATAPAGATLAQEHPQLRPPQSVLVLSVIPSNEPARSVVLTCDPPGGDHPRPAEACELLAEAGGDFTRLTGDPYAGACPPGPWEPVVATAFGWWNGRLTWYYRQFSSSCALEVGTWYVYHLAFRP